MEKNRQEIAIPEFALSIPELEAILKKGVEYLNSRDSKTEYNGKLFEANFAGFYELYTRKGVNKKHADALRESYALCVSLVDLNRCNEYGSEARFGGQKMQHPTYLQVAAEFDELLKKHAAELKTMKDEIGYTVMIYPKIVNKVKAEAFKAKKSDK